MTDKPEDIAVEAEIYAHDYGTRLRTYRFMEPHTPRHLKLLLPPGAKPVCFERSYVNKTTDVLKPGFTLILTVATHDDDRIKPKTTHHFVYVLNGDTMLLNALAYLVPERYETHGEDMNYSSFLFYMGEK